MRRLKLCTAILTLSASFWATAALAEPVEEKSKGDVELQTAAVTIYDEYIKLDQARDSKLIDLYAPNAHITSCSVSAAGDPVLKEYDRDTYAKLIAKTFADPATAKISTETKFDKPHYGPRGDVLDFTAHYAKSTIKISWKLAKETDGKWMIADERATIIRRDKEASPESNPDMHGVEQIRQFKRVQNSDGSPIAKP